MADPEVIDLDALTPPKAILKFNGQEIPVHPPKVGQALKLATAAQHMADLRGSKKGVDPSKIDAALTEIKLIIDELVPELKDHELTMEQLLIVTKAISNMIVPPDAKELAKKGITIGGGDADPKDQ